MATIHLSDERTVHVTGTLDNARQMVERALSIGSHSLVQFNEAVWTGEPTPVIVNATHIVSIHP